MIHTSYHFILLQNQRASLTVFIGFRDTLNFTLPVFNLWLTILYSYVALLWRSTEITSPAHSTGGCWLFFSTVLMLMESLLWSHTLTSCMYSAHHVLASSCSDISHMKSSDLFNNSLYYSAINITIYCGIIRIDNSCTAFINCKSHWRCFDGNWWHVIK